MLTGKCSRRSRTAKALRISRRAAKSRCAHEWDGWGRLSDDGPGHYNPDLSEGPWGGGVMILHGGVQSSLRPDTVRDNRCDYEAHEGRMQTGCRTAYAGSRLKLPTILESQPSSRTGENPPYGMIGGIEETSASFEARSAPRSYPTPISGLSLASVLGSRILLRQTRIISSRGWNDAAG